VLDRYLTISILTPRITCSSKSDARTRSHSESCAKRAAPVEHFAQSALECGAFSHRFRANVRVGSAEIIRRAAVECRRRIRRNPRTRRSPDRSAFCKRSP